MSKMIGSNKIRVAFLSLLFLVFIFSKAAGSDVIVPSRERCAGYWAAGAKSPYPKSGPWYGGADFIPTNTPSPDGKVSIKATREGLSLLGKGDISTHLDVYPPLLEVLWATDSRSFVINVSDGGLVGTWDVKFYSIDAEDRPVFRDITKLMRPIADKLLQCDQGDQANIAVVSWLNDGKEVLMVAEVPPHSVCRNMGDIFGFRVSVKSGKIIERISEQDLRKKWANVLGCRFGDCSANCVNR